MLAQVTGTKEIVIFPPHVTDLLDGAKYHTSQATRELFKRLDVDVVYTGPYSYDSSPVEQLFCHLKRGNLNPDGAATGTR